MTEYVCAGIFVREGGPMQAGEVVARHTHNFDHMTRITRGRFRVRRWNAAADEAGNPAFGPEGKPLWLLTDDHEVEAPYRLLIKAACAHEFTALENGSSYECLFLPRDPLTHEPVAQWNGWLGATV